MKEYKLSDISLKLANGCVALSKELSLKGERNFADQIKRSGTSVAANIAEGGHPQSRSDMISKFEIALKEAFETDRWLKMIKAANVVEDDVLKKIDKECTKTRVLLIASVKTLKENK